MYVITAFLIMFEPISENFWLDEFLVIDRFSLPKLYNLKLIFFFIADFLNISKGHTIW
jgi:hypothetical protein